MTGIYTDQLWDRAMNIGLLADELISLSGDRTVLAMFTADADAANSNRSHFEIIVVQTNAKHREKIFYRASIGDEIRVKQRKGSKAKDSRFEVVAKQWLMKVKSMQIFELEHVDAGNVPRQLQKQLVAELDEIDCDIPLTRLSDIIDPLQRKNFLHRGSMQSLETYDSAAASATVASDCSGNDIFLFD